MRSTGALSLRACIQLAAPHTWPASVLPVALGTVLASAEGVRLQPCAALAALAALAVAVLLQAGINTLNDFRDYSSGLDNAENCTDPTDAALIYEHPAPKAVLALGLGFLLCAALPGGLLVWKRGTGLLLYGVWAAAAIALYTLPVLSASELPLGELLSGVSMGGALTAAAFHVQTGYFDPALIWLTLPAMLTVGCIMLGNNTSDIEKDRAGGRRTLPVLAGRRFSEWLLRGALLLSALLVCCITLLRFPRGAAMLPVMAAALLLDGAFRGLYLGPMTPERRKETMAGVLSAHTGITASYLAAVLLHCLS